VDDTALTTLSCLAGLAHPGRHGNPDGPPGVTVRERPHLALSLLIARRGQADAAASALAARFGLAAPHRPKAVFGNGVGLVWAGPRHWLGVMERQSPEAAEASWRAALADTAAVIDQSSGRGVLRIAGPQARTALAKGMPIDLHPRAFGPGDAAITLAEQIAVQLWQVDDAPTYDIVFPRSTAGDFWHWLNASAAAYGLLVQAG